MSAEILTLTEGEEFTLQSPNNQTILFNNSTSPCYVSLAANIDKTSNNSYKLLPNSAIRYKNNKNNIYLLGVGEIQWLGNEDKTAPRYQILSPVKADNFSYNISLALDVEQTYEITTKNCIIYNQSNSPLYADSTTVAKDSKSAIKIMPHTTILLSRIPTLHLLGEGNIKISEIDLADKASEVNTINFASNGFSNGEDNSFIKFNTHNMLTDSTIGLGGTFTSYVVNGEKVTFYCSDATSTNWYKTISNIPFKINVMYKIVASCFDGYGRIGISNMDGSSSPYDNVGRNAYGTFVFDPNVPSEGDNYILQRGHLLSYFYIGMNSISPTVSHVTGSLWFCTDLYYNNERKGHSFEIGLYEQIR